jgi:glutamate-1-semialdehyde 2,1-aminomutase
MTRRYQVSEELLQKVLKIIPLGSQTFSKSITQYPVGASPLFMAKAEGSRVWDVDNNEYIDFINSLAAVTLGYNDPQVTAAVKAQLEDGSIFSLPHPIEMKVAEKIVEMVPCAEMVRFGKNGSDVTAGAIRLARAYTGRDHVAVCGYHGWQDWYIGATARNKGVPQAVRDLTHVFQYNDIDSLHSIFTGWPDQLAAVIMEPMNTVAPEDYFLHKVKDLAHSNGALFIFDETITGFRFSNGGAQEYFDITPDLATFGKGLANGYPVAAVAGRADIMRMMEEIFFSFTFGGETLSLAAAFATMEKLQKEPVIATLWAQGKKVVAGVQALIGKYGLEEALTVAGKDCWSFLLFKDCTHCSQWELKTLFLQEVFARGLLTIGTHNMSYSHSDSDIAMLLRTYDEVFPLLKEAIASGAIRSYLNCEPLEPLFKIR